ncbi:hypothetical protein GGP77_001598 [Salinibacter ruber]|uniref:hypothetical protein n=1 Tax=Salinibacter ruber TaxID=146919 RepID=UPI002167D32D|nr:hypothetical protein [Salinibacter ruber]MCS3667369.1 hypothetical protein [Salinibacter ruber]
MSEPQIEFETERETDAEPTPRAWEHDLKPMDGVDGRGIFGQDEDGNMFVIANVNVPEQGLLEGDWRANARLIAAAGTAAQEAREMGYDPQRAVEGTPEQLTALERCRRYFREQYREGELGALRSSILSEVEDALASAEGSEE